MGDLTTRMLGPLLGSQRDGVCSGALRFAGGHPCCCSGPGSSGPGGDGNGSGGDGGSSLYPTTPVTSSIGFGTDCPACIAGTVADELQVVVAGVAQDPDSIFTCEEDAWNGTYVLSGDGACCYSHSYNKPGLYPLVRMLVCIGADTVGRFVYFEFYDFRCTLEGSRTVRWQKYLNSDPTEPVDCGFNGLVLTSADLDEEASSVGGLCIDCDLSATTITLTIA